MILLPETVSDHCPTRFPIGSLAAALGKEAKGTESLPLRQRLAAGSPPKQAAQKLASKPGSTLRQRLAAGSPQKQASPRQHDVQMMDDEIGDFSDDDAGLAADAAPGSSTAGDR